MSAEVSESAGRQAAEWLADLDNFGKPPAKKSMVGRNVAGSRCLGAAVRSAPTTAISSPQHSLYASSNHGHNGDGSNTAPSCHASHNHFTRTACSLNCIPLNNIRSGSNESISNDMSNGSTGEQQGGSDGSRAGNECNNIQQQSNEMSPSNERRDSNGSTNNERKCSSSSITIQHNDCGESTTIKHNSNGQAMEQRRDSNGSSNGHGHCPSNEHESPDRDSRATSTVISYQDAISYLPPIDMDDGLEEGDEVVVDVKEKIKHFTENDCHPYANKNVQTSKLIESRGGTAMLTAFAKGDHNSSREKLKISKEEAAELTAQVRRRNRPINQWTSDTSTQESSGASSASNTDRQTNDDNSSGGAGGRTSATSELGKMQNNDNNSSSAYSSYSSVGTSSSQSTHTVMEQGNKVQVQHHRDHEPRPHSSGHSHDATPTTSSAQQVGTYSMVRAVPNIIDNKTASVSPTTSSNQKRHVSGYEIDELAREVAFVTNDQYHRADNSPSRNSRHSGTTWKSRPDQHDHESSNRSTPLLNVTSSSQPHTPSGDENMAPSDGRRSVQLQHQRSHDSQQPTHGHINRLRVNGRPSASSSNSGFGSSSLTTPNKMENEDNGAEFEQMLRQSIQSARRHSPGNSSHNTNTSQPIGMIGRDMIVDRIPPTDVVMHSSTTVPTTNHTRMSNSSSLHDVNAKCSQRAGNNINSRIHQLNQQRSLDHDAPPSNAVSHIPGGTRGGTRPPWRRSATAPTSQDPPPHNNVQALTSGSHGTPACGYDDRHHMSSMSMDAQQRRYEMMTDRLAERLDRTRMAFGNCEKCCQTIYDLREATEALGKLYHSSCFTCHVCGRSLRGKRFYDVGSKTYCEEDYLYSGFQQSAETCASCNHLIMDMVLQAVGRTYHPQCFRCATCNQCLDGIPFALDHDGQVYCVSDYHAKFAPKCAACGQPIMPISDSDETVRVVAMNRDYHVDCYVCEGCGTQLTDEPNKRCYPLGQHLLCHACHVLWSRTGGGQQPITDV